MSDTGNSFEYDTSLAAISPIYPQIAADMAAKGWQVVWATRNKQGEWTPLSGTTGGRSPFPSAQPQPVGVPSRIALRPPEDVKILDVDHYGSKLGWHTIELAEEELGPLPLTWKISARGADDKSGRYLYRVSNGLNFKDRDLWKFRDPDTGATSVEVVRTDHRFSWGPGDINPKTGTTVQVYGPDGKLAQLPHVDHLPYLPEAWHEFLADAPRVSYPQPVFDFAQDEVAEWWKLIPSSCVGTRDDLARLSFDMQLAGCDPEEVVNELLRVSVALDLGRPWTRDDLTGLTDANTQHKVAELVSEWNAITHFTCPDPEKRRQITERARQEDAYRAQFAQAEDRAEVAAQLGSPADYVDDEGVIVDADLFRRVVTGEFEFDPEGTDDQSLAEAVLDRINGARYCSDSGQWVVWGPEKWAELSNDLLPWVVSQLASSMPYGENIKLNEDSTQEDKRALKQCKNRIYLRSAAGAGSVITKARSLLAVPGAHKLSILRADIDADPVVLWAGGKCWDILASANGLVHDPAKGGTPHLMTAPCEPRDVEIPGFHALMHAVLPDEASREFWLDMMARGILGYQTKRTIPLAVGETKRGKTLLLERLPFGTYMSPVSGQDLLGSGDREEARRLNVLVGRRLPYIDEGIGSGKYTMGRLKKITSGGQKLPARGIFGKEYEFTPSHTLVMLVNPEEEPSYTDDAVKERFCRVEFDGDPEQIRQIAQWYEPGSEAWERETPGVLAFFIHRAAQIMTSKTDRGTAFDKPVSVTVAQDAVSREQDPVLDWLSQCTEADGETLTGNLYEHYLGYIRNRPVIKPNAKAFGHSLTHHGVPKRESHGKIYRGLTVVQAWVNAF